MSEKKKIDECNKNMSEKKKLMKCYKNISEKPAISFLFLFVYGWTSHKYVREKMDECYKTYLE